jgi:hypothetical protein
MPSSGPIQAGSPMLDKPTTSSTLFLSLAIAYFLALEPDLMGHEASPDPEQDPQAVASSYETRSIQGWKVLVNQQFLQSQHELADRTLTQLDHQLYQIVRKLPPKAVEKLRTIPIWVEEKEPHTRCMTYHPDPGWLREHGVNPQKARCIELANAHNFLAWTLEQPWMLLHELSHGYHHQFLDRGFDNPEIRAAYDRAMQQRLYDSVLRINGREVKAYATQNPKEFFAEMTEAFFGTNDFYPYVRSELQQRDPQTFELVKRLWGVPSNATPPPSPPAPGTP